MPEALSLLKPESKNNPESEEEEPEPTESRRWLSWLGAFLVAVWFLFGVFGFVCVSSGFRLSTPISQKPFSLARLENLDGQIETLETKLGYMRATRTEWRQKAKELLDWRESTRVINSKANVSVNGCLIVSDENGVDIGSLERLEELQAKKKGKD